MSKRYDADKTQARTTVILPETLAENLKLYCLLKKQGKGEVICNALSEFLAKEGFKPGQYPIVTHRY